jgi:hypothetical protein
MLVMLLFMLEKAVCLCERWQYRDGISILPLERHG